MAEEVLQVVEVIPLRTFKDKIKYTKEYDHKAKMEIIDNKYLFIEIEVKQTI